MLIDTVDDDFTTDWEKENEMVPQIIIMMWQSDSTTPCGIPFEHLKPKDIIL